MPIWTFLDYVSNAGNNQIKKWYDGLLVKERAEFDAFRDILGRTTTWNPADCRQLKGKPGLTELRFKSCGKQHRVVGQFGPEHHQYTLLIGCIHKQNIYDPPNALTTALERKKSLQNNTASLVEHEP